MLRKALGLSREGMHIFARGVAACAVANLVLMAPMCVLFLLVVDFLNHLVEGAPLPDLAPYAAGCIAILALISVTQAIEYRSTYGPVYAESARKRESIAEHLRRLPLSFFGKRDLSDLTSVIMKDCADQERMFMHVMPQLFGTGISSVVVIVGVLVFDWRLGLAAFWPVPVAFVLMACASGFAKRKVAAKEEARLVMADGVQEYLDCAREIRASNQTGRFLKALDGTLAAFERREIASELATGVTISSAQALLKLGIATTVLAGAMLIVVGQVSFMTYFAFLLIVTRVYDPINIVLQSSIELLEMRHAIGRTNALFDERPMTGSEAFAPDGYDIVFENVGFAYDGKDGGEGELVLRGVTFAAKEGEVTALVGPSGSGKSTAAKLAARFWDVQAGSVTLGGVDVSTVDPEALLSAYSVVFQDVVLFDDTVMENIRLGRSDATDSEVRAAARAANCDEFVRLLPDGYATRIGENGARLSGGERQRISIARALLKDAPVVLLDEATASLDVENETQVQEALSRLLSGKTVVVIAHRMRTVLGADKVVVLEAGRIAEQGSPEELLEAGGAFRRMIDLQSASACWSIAG